MLHVVDFRTLAGDTGEPNAPSIEPYNNGESADQTVLRRPTENTRTRTEVLRELLRQHVLLKDYNDAGVALAGAGTITLSLGGSGLTFTTAADLTVLPYATPGGGASAPWVASTKAAVSVGTVVNELVFTSVQKQFEGVTFPEADGNKISLEILDGGVGASLAVVVEGAAAELNNVKITIDASLHTLNNVIAAVAAVPAAASLVVATLGGSAVGTNLCPTFSTAEWGSDLTARFLRGGAPGIAHTITPAGLVAFFSNPLNELDDGETLAIAYDKIVNTATTGGRAQSTPENTNINVDAALFNTRREPEKIPNCIPVCKRTTSTSELTFVNGATIYIGIPATLTFDSYALMYAETGKLGSPLGWDRMGTGPSHNPPTTIRHALNNADGHIDNVLDEIEAARTTDFIDVAGGGYTDLEERMDKHAGHASGHYSLGPSGSDSMYTDLKTCLTDVIAAGGGTIIVKAPVTYTITGAGSDLPEITAPIRILGTTTNALTIINQRGADSKNVLGFSLRITGAATHCYFENVIVNSGATGSNWALYVDSLSAHFKDCAFAGGVVLTSRDHIFERCQFVEPGNASGEENLALLYMTDSVNATYYPSGLTGTPYGITVRQCTFDASSGVGIGLIVSGPAAVLYSASQDVPNLAVIPRGLVMEHCEFTCTTGIGAISCSTSTSFLPPCRFDQVTVYTEGKNNDSPCCGFHDQNISVSNLRIMVYATPATDRLDQVLIAAGAYSNGYGRGITLDGVNIETRGVVPSATRPLLYLQGAVTVRDLHMDVTLPDATNHTGTTRSATAPLVYMEPRVRGECKIKDSWFRFYSKGTPGTIPGLVCGNSSHQGTLGAIVLDNVVFDSTEITGDAATAVDFYFVNQLPDASIIKNCRFRLGAHVARALIRYRCNGLQIIDNTFMTPDSYNSACAQVMYDEQTSALQVGNGIVITGNNFFYSYTKIFIWGDDTYEPYGIVISNNNFINPTYQAGAEISMEDVGTSGKPGATIIGNCSANHSTGPLIYAGAFTIPVSASLGSYNAIAGSAGTLSLPTA